MKKKFHIVLEWISKEMALISKFVISWLFNMNVDNSSSIITIINISVTGFILLVTLSIIPFQKISDSLSGNLYNHFLRNKKFRTPIITNLIICLVQIVVYLFIPKCNFALLIYLISLFWILVNIYNYSQAVKEQLDLSTTCFPIIENELKKEVEKFQAIEIDIKKNALYALEDNKKSIQESLLFGVDLNKFPLGNPYQGYDKIFIYKIHQIYDLLIKNIDELKYSAYELSVESLFNSYKIYLNYLNNHSFSVDNVLLDFLDISKKILKKTSENNNLLYTEIYLGNLYSLIKVIAEKNINRDFYFARIIEFYGEEVIPLNKNDWMQGLSRFESLITIIFSQEEYFEFSFEKYIGLLNRYQMIIYKVNEATSKSQLNKTINSFAYEVFLNKSYLYQEKIIDKVLVLLKSIDTQYTIPFFDDFSTRIALLGKDKSIYSIIRNLVLNNKFETTNIKQNLYREEKIYELIEILKKRYKGKGSQVNSIISMLYNIYFDIFSLFDDFIFQISQINFENWIIDFKQPEKEKFVSILENILHFSIENGGYGNNDIIFSEIKLFVIILLQQQGSDSIKEYLCKNRKKLINSFILSPQIPQNLKIEVYKIINCYLPHEYKYYLSKKINKYYKEFNQTQKKFYFILNEYNKETFEIAPICINLQIKQIASDYINSLLFEFYYVRRKKIISNVIVEKFPISTDEFYTKKLPFSIILNKKLTKELIDSGILYIENNQIRKCK